MEQFVLRVTPEQLSAASNEIRTETRQMKENFSMLQETARNTAGYWTGPAGEKQRKAFQEQVEQIEQLVARFTEQSEVLNQLSGNYTQTRQTSQSEAEALPGDVIV